MQLPPGMLVSLYSNQLVLDQDSSPEQQAIKPPPTIKDAPTDGTRDWKFLGNNNKHILVMVDYKDAVHLPDDELAFLTKMLAACKLDLGDIALINFNNYRDAIATEFLARFKSKTILLFGIEPSAFGLPVNFPAYQVQQLASATYVHTPALEERQKDELFKSKLWICLKKIFHL